jgi:two-component system chemotaxis response regulator CheY
MPAVSSYSSSAPARLVIVDDNPVAREVLRGLIRQDSALRVVGEATDGRSAVECIRKLHPDLVCLDILMPGIDGLEVLRQLRAGSTDARVLVVSGSATPAIVQEVRALGCSGFVVKPLTATKLLAAIQGALQAPTR